MADEEEQDEENKYECRPRVPLLPDPEASALAPDLAEATPDQCVQHAQGHHGDEHADEKGTNHVVAKEIANSVEGGCGLDTPSVGGAKGKILPQDASVVDLLKGGRKTQKGNSCKERKKIHFFLLG